MKKKITIFVTLITLAGIMLPAVASSQQLPQSSAVALQDATLQKAKSKLLSSLDQLQTHFQKTQDKAATLTKFTEVTGADIVETIQGYLDKITGLRQQINDAQSINDLKNIAQQIHLLIQDAKQSVKKTISKRVEVRIDRFTQKINNGTNLIKKATNKIIQLKSQGNDTSKIQTDLDQCQQLMDKGAEELQDAKAKFNLIENSSQQAEDPDATVMKDALGMVKDARTTYSQARQNCASVIQELKAN